MPGLGEPRRDPNVAIEVAKQLGLKVAKDYPLNMASVFHIWFVMGFWTVFNYAILVAMTLNSTEAWIAKLNRFKVLIILLQGTVSVIFVIWLFLGVSWRFSDAGKTASGDNLLKILSKQLETALNNSVNAKAS